MAKEKQNHEFDWLSNSECHSTLLKWLDNGCESSGQKYEEMRRRLIAYFDRKQCPFSDDLTDQTFARVAKWIIGKQSKGLPSSENIDHQKYEDEPVKICFNTARFVYHEWYRKHASGATTIDDLTAELHHRASKDKEEGLNETRMRHVRGDCLDCCLRDLPPETIALIVQYYEGQTRQKISNRKRLAESLMMSTKNLSLRVLRLRDRLEPCVRKCVENRLS